MVAEFDRDAMARWYAENHTKIDPGVASVYHLWHGAPDREIRLLEVNRLLIERETDPLEAVDFGVDVGTENQTSCSRRLASRESCCRSSSVPLAWWRPSSASCR